jgi:signal transduction histidine kinase
MPAEQADYFDARDREALQSTALVDIAEEQVEVGGQLRVIHSQKLTLRDAQGRAQYLLGIIEDITERQRVERMKNEFVSTVSHELRTPLTVIAGALGLLADGVLERKPQRAREMIEAAHANSLRLTTLINDLLDMEKLAAGKMQFSIQREDLSLLVRQAIAENQGYAEQHGAHIHISGGQELSLPVNVDAQRLLQALANLLSNVAKYSPPGGEVEVQLRRVSGDAVEVAVRDQGPGIPAAFRERIFEKFAQADATNTRSKGGTGLGLAITRDLVEGMGGAIGFESEEGRGTSFHLRFPLADSLDA